MGANNSVGKRRSRATYTGPCLLFHLQPVRSYLQQHLCARDAMSLMRTSRSATMLLFGFEILDPDHALSYGKQSTAEVKRSIAFFAQYGIRILAMCLSKDWDEPLVRASSGQSVLPSSLVALTLGGMEKYNKHESILTEFAGPGHCERWMREQERKRCPCDGSESEVEFYRLMQRVGCMSTDDAWNVFRYGEVRAAFNQPIPPGALPRGLRFLQLNKQYNQPLQVGSIPDTVEVLQFGSYFNQRLTAGHLPSSLTHLNLGGCYNRPLLPGVLPAGLKRLHLGNDYDDPLQPGVLPSQLQQLSFGSWYNHPIPPGVIPSSVTHLRLSFHFDRPLQDGSIPEGVRHLNLGGYKQGLLPGMLPSSLRELVVSHSLQPGSLPDGLEVLVFHRDAHIAQPLLPGVIPASVRAVSLCQYSDQSFTAGAIPSTVQWLRLPDFYGLTHYRGADPSSVLSPSTRVVWHVGR